MEGTACLIALMVASSISFLRLLVLMICSMSFLLSMMIGDDEIEKYLLLASSHDGSLSLQVMFSPVRVVCANTLSAALNRNSNRTFIKHTINYKNKIAQARQLLGLTESYYAQMEIQFNKMLEAEMTKLEAEKFIEKLIPARDEDGEIKLSKVLENQRADILNLFSNGIGIKGTDNVNTRWAAYNAVTEYVDHHRATRIVGGANADETRMETILWNSGAGMKQRAFEMLS